MTDREKFVERFLECVPKDIVKRAEELVNDIHRLPDEQHYLAMLLLSIMMIHPYRKAMRDAPKERLG